MKKYFSIEESLIYLNKSIDISEKISIRDLLVFAAKKEIFPCFFYRGTILWRETKEGDKDETYRQPAFCSYVTDAHLGDTLLEFYNNGYDFFNSKWVTKLDTIYSELPDSIEKFSLYNEHKDLQTLLDIFYRKGSKYQGLITQPIDEMLDKEFLDFAYIASDFVEIKFSNVYFTREELKRLKGTSEITENIIEVKKEITTREKNNASLIIGAMAELLKFDLTQPYGDTNKQIREAIEKIGGKLSKDTIGRWLILARENIK